MKVMIKTIIFKSNQKPYIVEIEATLSALKNAISNDMPIKIDFKETQLPGIVIVYAINGLELRLKQNSWADNIVGTFAVCKYVDNELVDFDRGEIEHILKTGIS
jgi:hypothetical protein